MASYGLRRCREPSGIASLREVLNRNLVDRVQLRSTEKEKNRQVLARGSRRFAQRVIVLTLRHRFQLREFSSKEVTGGDDATVGEANFVLLAGQR